LGQALHIIEKKPLINGIFFGGDFVGERGGGGGDIEF
jgi:hypothetical protein